MSWRSRRSRCNSSATTEAVQETLSILVLSFIFDKLLFGMFDLGHINTHTAESIDWSLCVWLLAAAVMVCFHQCLGLWSVNGRLGVFVAVLSCYRWRLRCLRACGGPDD